MKRIFAILAIAAAAAIVGLAPAQGPVIKPPPTRTVHSIWRPVTNHPNAEIVKQGGHFVHFQTLNKIRTMQPGERLCKLNAGGNVLRMKATSLPIDWTKNFTLSFPMDLNDTYGDCYYAAGCHADNTWAGNSGQQFVFSLSSIQSRYFALSGGDNGLGDSDMQGEMMTPAQRPGQGFLANCNSDPNRTIASQKSASIVDWMQIDPTNPTATQTALQRYGLIIVTFGVPDNWINNSNTGAVWDVPARPDQNNGHAVIWNGCRASDGSYCLQTWGSYVWVTPAGAKAAQFTGWIAFSPRWFDAKGYAPNGEHITTLAAQWQLDGGHAISPAIIAQFPPPGNPPVPLAVTVANAAGQVGSPTPLTVSITGGTAPYMQTWNYGDNTTGTFPSHTYTAAGTFSGSVTVTDSASPPAKAVVSFQTVIGTGPPLPPAGIATLNVNQSLGQGVYDIVPNGSVVLSPNTLSALKADIDAAMKRQTGPAPAPQQLPAAPKPQPPPAPGPMPMPKGPAPGPMAPEGETAKAWSDYGFRLPAEPSPSALRNFNLNLNRPPQRIITVRPDAGAWTKGYIAARSAVKHGDGFRPMVQR